VKPDDVVAFGLFPEITGRLQVIAMLDAFGVDNLAPHFVGRREGLAGAVVRCRGGGGVRDHREHRQVWEGDQARLGRRVDRRLPNASELYNRREPIGLVAWRSS
jgi:hypothetical protein